MNNKKETSIRIPPTVTLPALAMRGLTVFPNMTFHFDVGREKSARALRSAAEREGGENRLVFLITQKDLNKNNPDVKDLYSVGCVAEIKQLLRMPDGNMRVLAQGIAKAKLIDFKEREPFLEAEIKLLKTQNSLSNKDNALPEYEALTRLLKDAFKRYTEFTPKIPHELYEMILAEKNLQKLTELIAFNVYMRVEARQKILETKSIKQCAETLVSEINSEIDILKIELDIQSRVADTANKDREKYYLKEQLQVISQKLNGNDAPLKVPSITRSKKSQTPEDYYIAVSALPISSESKEMLNTEVGRMAALSPNMPDYASLKSYLDDVISFPFDKKESQKVEISQAKDILDSEHYGLEKVKKRLLEYVAVNILRERQEKENALKPSRSNNIICLVGPPGVGKTSIAKSAANALGRKLVRISLGGVHDESEIRGHRRTYVGAMPGRLVKAIKKSGCINPVILLDEIDKMGCDLKGDPASALLEALDPEQNKEFYDRYFEIPINLSDVIFITTANYVENIPMPLFDRMEIIEINSYTKDEKFKIANKFLLPKQKIENFISSPVSTTEEDDGGEKQTEKLSVSDGALKAIVENYTREAGVRRLEQKIAEICRKAAFQIASEPAKKSKSKKFSPIKVTEKNLINYLGAAKIKPDGISEKDEIGLVNGLAWTQSGGTLLPLETLIVNGCGKIEITGCLGDVMTESTKIAVSLARKLSQKYGIDPDFYKNMDIHIHAPEGAVPKNGPSAGITLTTCIISALAGIPVRRDVAMTGEITLRGKVLPIGGLREKAAAAFQGGVKTIIIPQKNLPDLDEIEDEVKENVRFIPAENITDVLDYAFVEGYERFFTTSKPVQTLQ